MRGKALIFLQNPTGAKKIHELQPAIDAYIVTSHQKFVDLEYILNFGYAKNTYVRLLSLSFDYTYGSPATAFAFA